MCVQAYMFVWGFFGFVLVKRSSCERRSLSARSTGLGISWVQTQGCIRRGGWKGRGEGGERTDEKQEWEILNQGRLSERAKKLCKKVWKQRQGEKERTRRKAQSGDVRQGREKVRGYLFSNTFLQNTISVLKKYFPTPLTQLCECEVHSLLVLRFFFIIKIQFKKFLSLSGLAIR